MSRKPDEIAFYAEVRRVHWLPTHPLDRPFADAIAERMGIPDKRAHYLLEKWSVKGWWESGVSLRSGWFTHGAPKSLAEGEEGSKP